MAVDGDAFDFRLVAQANKDLEVLDEQRSSKDGALVTLDSFLERLVEASPPGR